MMRKVKYALAFVFGIAYASLWWIPIQWEQASPLEILLFVSRIGSSLSILYAVGATIVSHWDEDKE
jgi:hypothetical protein